MHDEAAFGRVLAPERMPWAPHTRWAVENDVLYVLDLRGDAYLSLPAAKLAKDSSALLEKLGTRGLLVSADELPITALTERLGRGRGTLLSCWRATLWARGIMRTRSLDRAALLLQEVNARVDGRASEVVERFRNWRPLYPRAASCLFDSLALGRFLWSAGVRSTLVFAVRGGPFAAHAWLEIGGVIVNDDPEYCAGFTPMRRP